jgi:hypothetical protein
MSVRLSYQPVLARFFFVFFFILGVVAMIGPAGAVGVVAHQKISNTEGNLVGSPSSVLDDGDGFGNGAISVGDLDSDGVDDVVTAAIGDDAGGSGRGAVWVLFLNSDGTVKAQQKISDTEGGFTGTLDNGDEFGLGLASLGDLDSDGVVDLAVGARLDDDGGNDRGAVWILFLNSDGTVKGHQKISSTEGGFTGTLLSGHRFGVSVATLGDLDTDGVVDIAVGQYFSDGGGVHRGAVWILFLNSDGTVKGYQKISDTDGGFAGVLNDVDEFGESVGALGDLDNDGVEDLAVGARLDNDGGSDRGAVWILFLNSNGTVKSHQKISDTSGGFSGTLDDGDWFGESVYSLGDYDADGVEDIAVGASRDDDGGLDRGAVWLLLLNSNGTVKSHQKISDTAGGFTGTLADVDKFGQSAAPLSDVDGDGLVDLVVGANRDDDGGFDRGAVWVLFLNSDGTVKGHQKISDTQGGLSGPPGIALATGDSFGTGVFAPGDYDGDGITDVVTGASGDDDGGVDRGAVWMLFLNSNGTVKAQQKISDTQGGFTGTLDDGDQFGLGLASLGDLDGDGVDDLVAGARLDDDGGYDRGAVWILFMNSDGTVKGHQKISNTDGGFTGTLADDSRFGISVASLGDLDGDGVVDVAVGEYFSNDGGIHRGAVWILFLNSNGTVKAHQKISAIDGGFTGTLDDVDEFGESVTSLGDLDNDGVVDIAVGTRLDDDGGNNRGAVWILFLNNDGTVKGHQKISDTSGSFTGTLDDSDWFGESVFSLGDYDGDGVGDVVVGACRDDDGGDDRGAVWMLFLNSDGTVKTHQKISNTQGGFTGALDDIDRFGQSVAPLGDLDGDGSEDLIVSAVKDDDGDVDAGALWVLFTGPGTIPLTITCSQAGGTPDSCVFDWSVTNSSPIDTLKTFYVDIEAGINGGPGNPGMPLADIQAPPGYTATFCYPWDNFPASNRAVVCFSGGAIPPGQTAGGEWAFNVSDTTLTLSFPGWSPFTVLQNGVHCHATSITPPGSSSCAMGTFGPHVIGQENGWTAGGNWVWDAPVPVLVTRFDANEDEGRVKLTWDVFADEDIRGFRVYRSEGAGPHVLANTDGLIAPESRVFVDTGVAFGSTYEYVLAVVTPDGSEIISNPVTIRTRTLRFALEQNHPNPFNPVTSIGFTLHRSGPVSLRIYDAAGRQIRRLVAGNRAVGRYVEMWDALDDNGNRVSSGVYFYRLNAGGQTLTRKMVFLK